MLGRADSSVHLPATMAPSLRKGLPMITKLSIRLALLCALAAPVLAQGAKPASDPAAGNAAKKDAADTFAVVQFHEILEEGPGQGYGRDRLQVFHKSEVEPTRKQMEEAFKKRFQEWEQAKNAARAAHQRFTKGEPKPVGIKVLNDTFKTEAEAKAFLEKEEKKLGTPVAPPPHAEKPK
jgi:hypothetical protein